MKTVLIYRIAFLVILCVLNSCINSDNYDIPKVECNDASLEKTLEINEVPASQNVTQYLSDDIIEAYVSSSDEGGNFFKSISFQSLDGNYAFSIPVDATATFVNFEPGRKVWIKLKNLYTDISNGGMRIGGIYVDVGVAEVGRLSGIQYSQVLQRSCMVLDENDFVQYVNISNLDNSFLNKLVELDNIQFTPSSVAKHYYEADNDIGGATNHYIEDAVGGTMVFRTSSFSNFAYKIVPGKSGKIRGVLTKFGDIFQFFARTENDIMMTDDRFAVNPVFIEDFNSAIDGTIFNIENWLNFAQSGNKLWKEETFGENGYAEFSGYGSGNAINVVWLISPEIDFGENASKIIRFKLAQHHLDVDSEGNSLQVLISTDCDGTNILDATWTPIAANVPTSSSEWYAWLDSVVDISSFDSQLRIAFKFTGSGTNTALDGAFDVDDVKAYGQ